MINIYGGAFMEHDKEMNQETVPKQHRFHCDACGEAPAVIWTVPVGKYTLSFVCSDVCKVVVLLKWG